MDRKIIQAHNKITKTKGKEYAPTFTEIQKEIDKMENKKTAVEWLESIIQAMNENGGDLGEDYPALLEHIKKAKQTYKYTEEDLIKAMRYSSEITNNKIHYMNKYIESLKQPKLPVAFTSQLEPLYKTIGSVKDRYGSGVKIANERAGLTMTTTNSEGQTVWLGTYQY